MGESSNDGCLYIQKQNASFYKILLESADVVGSHGFAFNIDQTLQYTAKSLFLAETNLHEPNYYLFKV